VPVMLPMHVYSMTPAKSIQSSEHMISQFSGFDDLKV
jgi:hypothetical protein